MGENIRMAVSLYINYILLGMINLIIALHMGVLTVQFHTDAAAISVLISAIGIGKLFGLSFAGKLSDSIGRKPMVITACILYVIFLTAIPFSPTYGVAFAFALVAGMGNSTLDTSTYPALIEGFPKRASSATVLVKAFMSIGATILPLLITIFIAREMFYGYTFFIIAFIFLINAIHLTTVRFPKPNMVVVEPGNGEEKEEEKEAKPHFTVKPRFWKEGITVIFIGFTSVSLLMVIQTWLAQYAEEIIGLNESTAINLLSYYSFGGFVTVILLAAMLDKVFRPITILILYPIIAIAALSLLLSVSNYSVLIGIAFILGLSTAGLFQLAVTLMAEFFPGRKGTSTAFVTLSSSIAFIIIPYVTGLIDRHIGVSYIFVFEILMAMIAMSLAIFISIRYRKIFNITSRKEMLWRNP